VGTSGPDGLWNNAVHFAYDSDLNIYFISQPSSRHMQNIRSDNEVALAIFSTSQPAVGDVVGLQIRGHATWVPDDQVEAAHKIYYARSPAIPGIPDAVSAYQGADATWKFVKVAPIEIGYFDTKNFGGRRQTVPAGVKL
jgi:uncharacterized protein YhbP (UPF0306 family)